jgi:hypothetical protein
MAVETEAGIEITGTLEEVRQGFTFDPGTPGEFFVPTRKIIPGGTFLTMSDMRSSKARKLAKIKSKMAHVIEYSQMPDGKKDGDESEVEQYEAKRAYLKEHMAAIKKENALDQEVAVELLETSEVLDFENDYRILLLSFDFSDYRVEDGTISKEIQATLSTAWSACGSKEGPRSSEFLMRQDTEEVRRQAAAFRRRVGVRSL